MLRRPLKAVMTASKIVVSIIIPEGSHPMRSLRRTVSTSGKEISLSTCYDTVTKGISKIFRKSKTTQNGLSRTMTNSMENQKTPTVKYAAIEVGLITHCGDDLSVVNAARVSMAKASPVFSPEDAKLLRYLNEHKHHSPFNHAFMSFRVKAPVFVARQLVKHKFLPWNEVSRRYVKTAPEFYSPTWRSSAASVKQGSAAGWEASTPPPYLDDHYLNETALATYNKLLEQGTCPEQARMVLPASIMTEWVWSGTLGAWLDMLELRLDGHAQRETREVAEAIADYTATLFPETFAVRFGG